MIPLLLVACGPTASLTVDGAPPFDDVKSVVWTLPQTADAWLLTDGALQGLGPSTLDGRIGFYAEPDFCRDAAETLETLAAASADLLGASADGTDQQALCEAVPSWLDALAEVDDRRANGEVRLSLGYCVGENCSGQVETPSYPFGDTSNASWTGLLTYTDAEYADGSYARAAAAWNVDACAFDADAVEAEAEAIDQWVASDGDIYFSTATAQHLVGQIDGSFADTHGNTATVTGSFTADVCEMPAVESLVFLY